MIVQRNNDPEKRAALRNAVLNVACGRRPSTTGSRCSYSGSMPLPAHGDVANRFAAGRELKRRLGDEIDRELQVGSCEAIYLVLVRDYGTAVWACEIRHDLWSGTFTAPGDSRREHQIGGDGLSDSAPESDF